MKAEISFDLIMEENMSFVEGTFRLPDRDWQVFIYTRGAIEEPEINPKAKWESGVTGIHVCFPKSKNLNKTVVLRMLAKELSVTEWQEVKGPDSMQLR